MDKKIKGKRGSEYPLKLRGFALLLSLMILCSYFPVYAIDEYVTTDEKFVDLISNDNSISTYVSDDVISSMHYETMNTLADLKQTVINQSDRLTNNMTSLKEKIFAYIDNAVISVNSNTHNEIVGIYSNNIAPSLSSLKIQLQSHITELYSDYISPSLTSLKTQVNAHTDEVFNSLQNTVQQGSIDIQNNADKNSQNQIDNANKNSEEQQKNDNENTSKIGGFFDKLFDNISTFLKSLFMPSDDYFDNLRVDLDTYLSEHLGVVYELPAKLYKDTEKMVNGIRGKDINSVTLYVRVPEISFTLNGEKHIFLASQNYNLFAFLNHMSPQFISAYKTSVGLMRALIDIVLAVSCFRMIYNQIINKVGIEGGSDL